MTESPILRGTTIEELIQTVERVEHRATKLMQLPRECVVFDGAMLVAPMIEEENYLPGAA